MTAAVLFALSDPYLSAVFETRLRALIGVPLFLLGVWLIFKFNRFVYDNPSWRDWLVLLAAFGCIFTSYVLLLFRGSLTALLMVFLWTNN